MVRNKTGAPLEPFCCMEDRLPMCQMCRIRGLEATEAAVERDYAANMQQTRDTKLGKLHKGGSWYGDVRKNEAR